MQVANRDLYFNKIYKAVIVNDDTSMDPSNNNRVQIYIPNMQYRYQKIYQEYMNDNNKSNSKYKNKFPWAISLVSDLVNGNIVYGSYIDNQASNFIVLGLDANNPANSTHTNGVGGAIGMDSSNLINLVMPVIVMEETGYGKSQCPALPAWPAEYPNSIFETIENTSSAARGLGLLQWTGSRGFDLLYDIAVESKNEWRTCWSDKSLSLYQDIDKALKAGSASSYRNNSAMSYAMASGSPTYNAVKKMLQLDASRVVQIRKAPEDTQGAVNKLQSDPYNISNPGIIIFYADIMNQYGNGVNSGTANRNIDGCLDYAAKVDKSNDSIMAQVDKVYKDWCNRTKLYADRRSRVYSYIKWLDTQGKLQYYNLVSDTIINSKYIPEYGEYLWPCEKTTYITAFWGDSSEPFDYEFKGYNSGRKAMGYGSIARWHAGTDFGCPQGEKAIAVGSGTVSYVCSPAEGESGGQGGCIIIQMDKNKDHYFAYMHLCKKPDFKVGDKVKAGQVVGYTGNTGNSTGPHLHVGLHIGAPWGFNGKARDSRIDPLDYFGKKANS